MTDTPTPDLNAMREACEKATPITLSDGPVSHDGPTTFKDVERWAARQKELPEAIEAFRALWNPPNAKHVLGLLDEAAAASASYVEEKVSPHRARAEAAEAALAEARAVCRELLEQWPDDSVPSGPLCVRAAKVIGGSQ